MELSDDVSPALAPMHLCDHSSAASAAPPPPTSVAVAAPASTEDAAPPADAWLAAAGEPMDTGPSQPLPTVGAWARIAGLAARPTLNGTLPRPPSSARCPRTAVMLCTGCGVSFGYGYV